MSKISLKTWHFLLVFAILGISSTIIWSNELEKNPVAGRNSSLVELNDRMFSDSVVTGTCIVLFYTKSDVCYKMEQNLNQLNNATEGHTRFFKLNIEDYPGEYGKYVISGTPTTIIFKDGQEIDRIMGIVPVSNLLMLYKRSI
ncbi:thioredoxin family protein [Dysgonomonas sp. HDW5A]|uniref:thioredoxin family protein n=1 Tax=Dysgonomonas sp. HDW5A TaxID=2714926 RepID=UPI00140A5BD1|nr:thioredoxin family protein [Dysgonomonas sp. HDW5A]QIK60959.1 thioredoxin family protein [Dysgonomonas sp. HDW5A]